MKVKIAVCDKCYYWPINGEEHQRACKQCGNVDIKYIFKTMPTTPFYIPMPEALRVLHGMPK
jgi:hypothetical protein